MRKVNQEAKKIKLDIKKVKLNIKLMMWLLMFPFLWGCGSSTGTGAGGGNPSEGINLTASKLGISGGFVDVDGDGITDKIIGAPSGTKSSDLGIVLVYKGDSTGYASTYTTMAGDNSFGSSFVNLGDVDGDSKEDFAIGAIYGDGEDVSMSGAVHIYKGGSNGQTIIRKLAGEGPMDRFGISMASGDLNGDGKNDIIIGAPFNTNDPALYQSGAVYVYFAPDFTTQVALHASSKNKGLGWQAASGDINNDGIPDLLISASGKVLGYYGGTSFAPNLDSPDLTISSSATGFGKSIVVMGDVDSDGYRDMVIGAPNAVINNNRDTGSIYVVKGGTSARTINLNSAATDQIVRIDGVNLFDRFGASIAAVDAGDGDSLIDIAVGAPLADVDTSLIMAGKVYLFKGKDIGSTTILSNATVFNGDEKYQGYGTVITAAPDHCLLLGMPMCHKYSGHVSMIDLVSGQTVTDGSSGGSTGDDHHEHDH
jgi:hypothetical protein